MCDALTGRLYAMSAPITWERSHPWGAVGVITAILATAAAAMFGSRFPADAWYRELDKPALTPPGAVFPIVWTVLYLFIAIAGANILARNEWTTPWRVIWLVQIGLNGLWSYLFFGEHQVGLALIDVIALTLLNWAIVVAGFQVQRLVGWLFLPYALWTTFATYLNLGILVLNR